LIADGGEPDEYQASSGFKNARSMTKASAVIGQALQHPGEHLVVDFQRQAAAGRLSRE
jgi:hypothetical protein